MGTTPNPLARLHTHADLAGATASTLCLIHCLLTPIIISLFPNIIPYLPGDALSHRLLAVGVVLFGLIGFVPGYRLHRRRPLLALITVGMALILTVAWSGERLNEATELTYSIIGSLLLVTAHLLNRSFCRQCLTCNETSKPCQTTRVS